jgi:hypothetical protein
MLIALPVSMLITTGKRQAAENLAFAQGRKQYEAVAAVFERFADQEERLAAELRELEQKASDVSDLDAEVAAALSVLDRLTDLAASPKDLEGVGQLFRRLNARPFLQFAEVKWKKRSVNKVCGGVVTFGEAALPVALYQGPTARQHVQNPGTQLGSSGSCSESPGSVAGMSGTGGDSLGNVNRADWI